LTSSVIVVFPAEMFFLKINPLIHWDLAGAPY
jgi:hypothetical protein